MRSLQYKRPELTSTILSTGIIFTADHSSRISIMLKLTCSVLVFRRPCSLGQALSTECGGALSTRGDVEWMRVETPDARLAYPQAIVQRLI